MPLTVTLVGESQARSVSGFRIARYPVTWAQYRNFLDANDGYCNKAWWQGRPREDEPGPQRWSFANCPALNISWYDAVAYCGWLSSKLSLEIRLPMESEWQWAAVGDTQQGYPWPGNWNPARANSGEAGIGRTVAVGLYPLGRNLFGLDDMAGNIWEWCLNTYDQPSNVSSDTNVYRWLRGGSWDVPPDFARSSARCSLPEYRSDGFGFRVLCSSPIE